jgi:hypothetical protein
MRIFARIEMQTLCTDERREDVSDELESEYALDGLFDPLAQAGFMGSNLVTSLLSRVMLSSFDNLTPDN